MREEFGSRRNDFRAQGEHGEDFRVFMRQSIDFAENFSIGLDYVPRDGSGRLCLIRCNGPHGPRSVGPLETIPHFAFHIHLAKEENIIQGSRPERGGEITKEFASYDDALRYFLRRCNVEGWDKHFPNLVNGSLFDGTTPTP